MAEIGELLAQAARGDQPSFAALALISLDLEHVPIVERLTCAEAFARLAAQQGGADDWLLLASILFARVHECKKAGDTRLETFATEALSILEGLMDGGLHDGAHILAVALSTLADQGDEMAAVKLNSLMDRLNPTDAAALSVTVTESLRAVAASLEG